MKINKLPVMTLQELDTHQDQVDQELVWVVSQVIAHVPVKVTFEFGQKFQNLIFLNWLFLKSLRMFLERWIWTIWQFYNHKKVCSKIYVYIPCSQPSLCIHIYMYLWLNVVFYAAFGQQNLNWYLCSKKGKTLWELEHIWERCKFAKSCLQIDLSFLYCFGWKLH